MPEPTEVTLSWYDYTVLLGYAFHHADDQETRGSLNRIMERTRNRITEQMTLAAGTCTAVRGRGGLSLLCTEPAGHPLITDKVPPYRNWQHYDGGRSVFWDEVIPDA